MTARTISHGSFTLERTYPVPVSRAFAAWADPAIKSRWFGSDDPAAGSASIFEFREGGREYSSGTAPDGASYTFDVRYADIVPDARIVYTYEMTLEGRRISVSVASVEFESVPAGTSVKVTEHGMFLDGLDTAEQRRGGTEWLLGKLGEFLERETALP